MPQDPWLNGTVAIVDDEQGIVEIYRRLLEMQKIPVAFVAFDGHEAIEKFTAAEPKPRIILMDYRLPTMDGVKASKEILKLDPAVKIIFLSADTSIEADALKAGAVMFINKPASIKDIVKAVQTVAVNDGTPND